MQRHVTQAFSSGKGRICERSSLYIICVIGHIIGGNGSHWGRAQGPEAASGRF
jgi:hypothetical protein